MQMTVNQNAPLQGAEAINSVIALLNGELPEGCDPETFIFNTDAQAITIDNADEVLAIFGH